MERKTSFTIQGASCNIKSVNKVDLTEEVRSEQRIERGEGSSQWIFVENGFQTGIGNNQRKSPKREHGWSTTRRKKSEMDKRSKERPDHKGPVGLCKTSASPEWDGETLQHLREVTWYGLVIKQPAPSAAYERTVSVSAGATLQEEATRCGNDGSGELSYGGGEDGGQILDVFQR